MTSLIIVCFVLCYIAIVFEHTLKLDKTIPALLAGMICWTLIALGHIPLTGEGSSHDLSSTVLHHLGKVTEILIFLIGAMTIVEIMDAHKGFEVITDKITTTNKQKLLWIISWLAFFFSAALDNLTTTIIFVSLLKKLVPDRSLRIWYVGFIVMAANAGGAWSPIGDVTTTMLWIEGKVTSYKLISNLLLPSIICLLVPLMIGSFLSVFKGTLIPAASSDAHHQNKVLNSKLIFYIGIGCLLFVPVFKSITHLPPWMGMMLSLSILWLVSESSVPTEGFEEKEKSLLNVRHALSRIEMPSILFFLGILMAITALESIGLLKTLSTNLNNLFPSRDMVATVIGFLSAVIDNVPLVAASIGMYTDVMDAKMWHFIAFSAGTGGSMLIIGSAAGVAAMGLERIDFIWYLKKIGWLAAVGFLAGCLYISVFL